MCDSAIGTGKQRRLPGRLVPLLLVLTLLAACGGADDTPGPVTTAPDPTPTVEIIEALGDFALRGPETFGQAVPGWQAPETPISVETVASVTELGVLDAPGRRSTVFSYDFSPDGTALAALNNTLVIAWDLITGTLLLNNTRQDDLRVYYSPGKDELYSVRADGTGVIYDAERGRETYTFRSQDAFNQQMVYDQRSGMLAVGGSDGGVRVWDMLARAAAVTLNAHNGSVARLAFSPDGRLLATGGDDQRVIVWDWAEREALATFELGARPANLAFSSDSSLIAVGAPSFVSVWAVDGEFRYTLQTGAGGAADVLEFSPGDRYLLTGGQIPDMIVWRVDDGEVAALLPGVGGDRVGAAFSPDGDLLLTSVLDGPVSLWDVTRIVDQTIPRADLPLEAPRVLDVAFTPDGFQMLLFEAEGPIRVWGVPPGIETPAP
ncbi:MAG: WD40 repeat domain-containing protein [Chloroflexota bacterium]